MLVGHRLRSTIPCESGCDNVYEADTFIKRLLSYGPYGARLKEIPLYLEINSTVGAFDILHLVISRFLTNELFFCTVI